MLLFVHAGLWSFVWRDAIVRLRDDFRCVTLDFPGHGLSGDGPHSLAAHTDELEKFVGLLGLQDVTLVAHDLGGPIGFGWAVRHPEVVRGLVAVNTFAWPPHGPIFRGMLRMMGSRPVRALDVATGAISRATSTRFGIGRHLDRDARSAFREPFGSRGSRAALHDLMRDAARSRELLSSVEQGLRTTLADLPVLTIFGERNDPLRLARRWKAIFADARQIVVPKGFHFPMCDDPDLFASTVLAWHAANVASRAAS